MSNLKELLPSYEYYHILKTKNLPTITPIQSQENPRKVPNWYFGGKADSSGKFSERNLIFLVGFIFMICLANLITTGILIYFFLETLH